MDISTQFLTQFLGLFVAALAFMMLVRRKMVIEIFTSLFSSRSQTFILGLVLFVIGLFVVLQRDLWDGIAGIVTGIVGWLILIEASLYFLLPKKSFTKIIAGLRDSWVYYTTTGIYLLAGLYLILLGFFG